MLLTLQWGKSFKANIKKIDCQTLFGDMLISMLLIKTLIRSLRKPEQAQMTLMSSAATHDCGAVTQHFQR